MKLNLDELERLASAATPGPWHAPGMGEVHSEGHQIIVDVCSRIETDAPDEQVGCGTEADAEYIAAMNPAVMQSLIAALRAARETMKRITTEHIAYDSVGGTGMYPIGVVDGHRCAANHARAFLATYFPEDMP